MVREHHVAVLLANHVSAFYMKLYISGRSQVKYTYMIGREHSHVVLPDHASLSRERALLEFKCSTFLGIFGNL